MKGRNNLAIAAVLVALLVVAALFVFLRPGLSPDRTAEQTPSETPAPTPPAVEEKQAGQPSPPKDQKAEAQPPATGEAEEKTDEESPPAESKAEEKIDEDSPSAEDRADGAAAPQEEKATDAPASKPDETADARTEADQAKEAPAAEEEKTAGAPVPPSFDVVRIEPTGDGVIAGRAEPGWRISVESGGDQVAMAEVDEHGEWTVILDRPLAPGSHTLSLRATSPDGKERSSSTQTVSAKVATPPARTAVAGTPEPASAGAGTASTVKPAPAPVPTAPKPPAPEAVQAERDATPGRVTRGEASPLPQTASVEEEKAERPSALAPQDRPGTYTILKGDTLWDIAQRYLGAGWRYKTIYRDNRKIIRNPNLIYPEQRMSIPEPPGESN